MVFEKLRGGNKKIEASLSSGLCLAIKKALKNKHEKSLIQSLLVVQANFSLSPLFFINYKFDSNRALLPFQLLSCVLFLIASN